MREAVGIELVLGLRNQRKCESRMETEYGEPWEVENGNIVNGRGETVVYGEGSLRKSEAFRIVACVNAMAGKEVDVPSLKGGADWD